MAAQFAFAQQILLCKMLSDMEWVKMYMHSDSRTIKLDDCTIKNFFDLPSHLLIYIVSFHPRETADQFDSCRNQVITSCFVCMPQRHNFHLSEIMVPGLFALPGLFVLKPSHTRASTRTLDNSILVNLLHNFLIT